MKDIDMYINGEKGNVRALVHRTVHLHAHIYTFLYICVHTFDVSKSCSIAATSLSLFYDKTFKLLHELVGLFNNKKPTNAFVTFSSKAELDADAD